MKSLNVTHIFEINRYNDCIAIGECRLIGNYFRAIRKNFSNGNEYIGPWVNWSNHTDLTYLFTALPVGERFTFTENPMDYESDVCHNESLWD